MIVRIWEGIGIMISYGCFWSGYVREDVMIVWYSADGTRAVYAGRGFKHGMFEILDEAGWSR